jgi:hypothetical protein
MMEDVLPSSNAASSDDPHNGWDWPKSTVEKLNELVSGPSGMKLGSTVTACLHPSAGKTVSVDHTVSVDGNVANVTISIGWKGGLIGTLHETVLLWTFDDERHRSLQVVRDSGPWVLGSGNIAEANEYFKREVYPTVGHR